MSQQHDWLLEHMPPSLREIGPQELSWWQWLSLPALAVCALALAIPLSRLSRALLARMLRSEQISTIEVVESRGSALAFPTRTVQLETRPAAASSLSSSRTPQPPGDT
ncbi:MAG: hypothetical protein ABI895_14590 [Deltaproteobacteria bacterium]